MIRVENLHKHFGGFHAVDGASLEIANGPGEKILPGELTKGLELLKEGKAIDYDGATSVTFVNGRENAGTFREIAIKDGKIETVTYR